MHVKRKINAIQTKYTIINRELHLQLFRLEEGKNKTSRECISQCEVPLILVQSHTHPTFLGPREWEGREKGSQNLGNKRRDQPVCRAVRGRLTCLPGTKPLPSTYQDTSIRDQLKSCRQVTPALQYTVRRCGEEHLLYVCQKHY